MIAKAVKGRGFRGALEYDLGKEQGRVIDTNMNGGGTRALATEFGEIRKLRPGLGKAVLHVSLSAAPGEHLTDTQWIEIGRRYLHGMGLDRNQYIVTRHTDTDHEHIHLLANRIQFDGAVTSDSHDYRRQEVLMREIERDLGLRQVGLSENCERRAATKGEIEEGLRNGHASTRQQLQQLCDAAMARCSGFADYAARLAAAGVELVPVTQLDGTKLSGLSYRLDGVTMKGSDLGKRYSPSGLAKQGVGYDKERDFEAVGRCLECGTPGQIGAGDRGTALGPHRERGAAGIDAGAVGAGDGRTDGRNAADPDGDRAAGPRSGREVQEPGRGSDQGVDPGIDTGAAGSQQHGRSGPPDRMASLSVGSDHRAVEWLARERIVALASPLRLGGRAEHQRSCSGLQSRDTTQEAIQRQIAALGGKQFDVLLREVISGKPIQKEWSTDQVLKNVAWLQRMNARGHNIFIRPNGEHGLALLGALNGDDLAKMSREGLVPAVSIEIARDEFEAWVKLSNRTLPAELRRLAELELMGLITDARKKIVNAGYGRLAGFVNLGNDLDSIWRVNYVFARKESTKISQNAKFWLERARTMFEDRNKDIQSNVSVLVLPNQAKSRGHRR
nr:relaxase/mobilization nuclease domain-containing protein [Pseudoduganella lurida]